MAGKRLEHWSTLCQEELQRRVLAEERRTDLSFVEIQLLDAARGRLKHWRAPITTTTKERTKTMRYDTETVEDVETIETETIKKPRAKKATTKKATTKKAPAAKSKAKKTPAKKKAAASTKKATKKTATPKEMDGERTRMTIADEAVLSVRKSFKNPHPEGGGPFKRFEIMMRSAGKTYGALRSMSSLKPTTPLNFVKAGGGTFE